jgi:hypothetical protein
MSPGAQNMKTGPEDLGTAGNESGSAKHDNWTLRPQYRWKWVEECNIWKRDLTPSVPPKMGLGPQNMNTRPMVPSKMSLRVQNMKTGPDALGIVENESRSAKHENGTRRPRYHWKRVRERKTWKNDLTPSVPLKTSSGAQNMKTGPNDLGTVENESGNAKYENRTRCSRNSRNEFGSAKHVNGTRRSRFHRKRVEERKTWKRFLRKCVRECKTWILDGPRYRWKLVRERKIRKRDPTPSEQPKN